MSTSYVALAVELPDLEAIYPVLETESQPGRQTAFLAFVNEQFDSEYEEDIFLEDVAIEAGKLIAEFQCSTELCNEITHMMFEGLAEQEGSHMLALEYNSRIGVYTCMAPGYDEAEYIDECFDDFDGLMHELEEIMDRREQLLHVLELAETEPLKSNLREFLDLDDENLGDEDLDDEDMEDEDLDEEDESEEFPEEENEEEPARNPLMDELEQALADQDEERFQELFEQIQQK